MHIDKTLNIELHLQLINYAFVFVQAAELHYIRLVIGNHDLSKRDAYERTFRVDRIEMHPDFRKNGPYSNDIAIIKVRTNSVVRVMFNSHVQPICLPKFEGATRPGTWCTVTGWGAQNGMYDASRFRMILVVLEHSSWSSYSRRSIEFGACASCCCCTIAGY